MMKITREYVRKCINNERKARAMHREENSRNTWLELKHCIDETDYALKNYKGKIKIK